MIHQKKGLHLFFFIKYISQRKIYNTQLNKYSISWSQYYKQFFIYALYTRALQDFLRNIIYQKARKDRRRIALVKEKKNVTPPIIMLPTSIHIQPIFIYKSCV